MNLSERISNIIALRSQELYFLLLFVRDFDAYIHRHRTPSQLEIFQDMPDNIKTEFLQYFEEFAGILREFIDEVQEPPSKDKIERKSKFRKDYSQEVTKYLFPFIIALLKPVRYPQFLYDTAVTHTVAIFESFLSDFLATVFTLRPSTLKSENTATYEEILSFSSRKELINRLASNRAEKILEGDLKHNVAKKLNDVFSIDICAFDKFEILYEAFCRRHVIVHKDGVTDKEYCQKIPNSKIGVEVSTDLQYVETFLMTIGQFIDYLDGCFSRKMRYRRNPFVNQLLNPPDSVRESKDSS